MELEIIVNASAGYINANLNEIKDNLNNAIMPYEHLVITPESIKDGKDMRAKLNRIKKMIDDKRKAVKSEYTKPLTVFENECKELNAIIDKGVLNIDTQLKEYEEKDKELRKEEIINYFNCLSFHTVSLDKIFDEKWLNKSCSEKTWKDELNGKIECIKADMAFLQQEYKGEELNLVMEYYLETLSVQSAITRLREHKTMQEIICMINVEDDLLERTFTVRGTKEQIALLNEFLIVNNIAFKRI